MNIGQAIVLLIDNYEYAKKQDYIIKKVAWALYQTRKQVDEKEEKQNEITISKKENGCCL